MKKTSSSALYPNEAVGSKVTAYSAEHSTALPKHLVDYHALVEANNPRSAYMISDFQAQALVFFARAFGSKRILEIGSFVGYSALVWAHAIGEEGKITGLEYSQEYADIANEALKRHGVKNAEILQGDALETLSKLNPEEPYDLIFIDAQKSGYPTYLKDILAGSQPGSARRLLRPGGIIIADNVLRKALVVDETENNPFADPQQKLRQKSEYETDKDIVAMREFNDALASNERLEAFLMPLYDGVGFARLLD